MSDKSIVYNELPKFSRKFSALISSGMPIMSVLHSLQNQTTNKKFESVIGSIINNVETGTPLSVAMNKHPAIFDYLYVNIIAAGETSGRLAETMERLALYLESSTRLKRKIKSALIYPAFVVAIASAICISMVIFIVPVFAALFDDASEALPAPTRMLMNVSEILRSSGLEVIAVISIIALLLKYYSNTPSGSFFFDSISLRLPIWGDLNRKVAASRFARTFGELIKSGVPILTAIEISSGATGNDVTAAILKNAKSIVENGEPLSSALVNHSAFPAELAEMLQAGEKSGKVDQMMDSIANYLDDEIDATVSGLTSLMTPVIILVLGVIIGGIIIAMFLPIIRLPGLF